MQTHARTTQQDQTEISSQQAARTTSWRRRIRTLLHREEREDDGIFRPVMLPLWMDLGISAGIVMLVAGTFGGFIYFLARTQGR